MRKKQKGFTFVEVLVAIAILGVLSTIAIAGLSSVLGNGRTKYYNNLEEMVVSAAKEYFSDNKDELPIEIDDSEEVLVSTLVKEDYIDVVKDANGDPCSEGNASNGTKRSTYNKVQVTKINSKDYEYNLTLSCPDPKMKEVKEAPSSTNQYPTIKFNVKGTDNNKKKTVEMCINGRTDYTYEVFKEKEGKYVNVNTKKGNLKSNSNCVNIELNYGSGNYKIRGKSGKTVAWASTSGNGNSNSSINVEVADPSCEGLIYEINHVAKQWFKGSLDVKISLDEENDERYFINSYEIKFGNNSTTFKGNGSKSYKEDLAKKELVVIIHNSAGDDRTCKLGEYWMDNTPPKCVNAKPNNTWTNRQDFKVSVECDDNDIEGGKSSVKQSGCKVKLHEDGTEGLQTDFNYTGSNDQFYIEDNVGNVATSDSNCKFNKKIDRTKPYCKNSDLSKRPTWTQTNFSFARCTDDLSGCTAKTSYQTDSTNGEFTTFNIADEAGNTNTCTAEKRHDDIPPTCASKSSHTNWSKTGQAWATCSDSLSGCTNNGKYYGSTIDGELEDVQIRDNAGNSTVCRNASKRRDNVKPVCTRYDVKESTTTGWCYSSWSWTDTEADPPQTYQFSGNPVSFRASCTVNSTAYCSDALSKCKSNSTNGSPITKYSPNPKYSCNGSGCCNGIRGADCSTVRPQSIRIFDNAGNYQDCTTNSSGSAPPAVEQQPSDQGVPASCNLVHITPEVSEGVWHSMLADPNFNQCARPNAAGAALNSFRVTVKWDTSSGIKVTWPQNEGTVSGTDGNLTITYQNQGYYGTRWHPDHVMTVTDKSGHSEQCSIPEFLIDNTPPTGNFRYQTTNVRGTGTQDRCLGSIDNRVPLGSISQFIFSARFNSVNFQDPDSGIAILHYQMAPAFFVVHSGLPNLTLQTDSPTNGKPIWTTPVTYSNQGQVSENGVEFSTGINMSGFSEAYRGGEYCYDYCVAITAVDAAGNSYQAGSYGTENSGARACCAGWNNHDD